MSIRAYFVKKLEYDHEELFNITHNEEFFLKLQSFVDPFPAPPTPYESLGLFEIYIEDWKTFKEYGLTDDEKMKYADIIGSIDDAFIRKDGDYPGEVVRLFIF